MSIVNDLGHLTVEQIEDIEKLTLRWLVQATLDFGIEAYDIFKYSPDNVKDVAEDITREITERLAGYNLSQRVFGTVDYKKARYIILPDKIVRQALFLDSKAENSESSATLQISQTSMEIRQIKKGASVTVQGQVPTIYRHDGSQFLSTTVFLHYHYEDVEGVHQLKSIIACCVPNGILQNIYNPSHTEGFWNIGRDSPERGEDFRVRVSFAKLKKLANWRVQKIVINSDERKLVHVWDD